MYTKYGCVWVKGHFAIISSAAIDAAVAFCRVRLLIFHYLRPCSDCYYYAHHFRKYRSKQKQE